MPRENIYDGDGNEITDIPTEEELKAQIDSSKNEFEQGIRKEYEIPEDTSVKEFVKGLEEATDPNYKEVRQKFKRYEQIIEDLKSQGKEVDDTGKIIDKPDVLSKEDIEKTSQETTQRYIYDTEKAKLLSSFSEDEKKVVNSYLTKLMTGEDQTVDKLLGVFKEAVQLAIPERTIDPLKRSVGIRGESPLRADGGNTTLSSEQKDFAKKFGITDEEIKLAEENK